MLNEFDIIEKFFTRPVKNSARFPIGIGDDAALLATPAGYELATSIDTLNVGVHFPNPSDPNDIGYKSLAVGLSDLAAMGAEPAAVLLALTLPEAEESWLQAFAAGFFDLAKTYSVELIGGNITRGPLSISTVVFGWTPCGEALRRSGAQPGDDIYVSGFLGDAGLGLQFLQQNLALPPELHQRFFRPKPRVSIGIALRSMATAAIDISDGLAADLEKLLTASGVSGCINTDQLPLSPLLRSQPTISSAITLALTAGEDYELCFTAPPAARPLIENIFSQQQHHAYRLGDIRTGSGLKIFSSDGKLLHISNAGYQHF